MAFRPVGHKITESDIKNKFYVTTTDMKLTRRHGHIALFCSNTMWGILSPVSKMLLAGGAISATVLADIRLVFGTLLFWFVSLFVKTQKIDRKDYVRLFAAAFFSASLNQMLFVNGVALTSPVDACICTSTLPIWTMLMAAAVLKEPMTGRKVGGVSIGLAGTLILVLSGTGRTGCTGSDILGNILCLGSQISYGIYLVFFQDIIRKYTPLTLMKWKYLFGALMLLPFSSGGLLDTDIAVLSAEDWYSLAYILFCGTFLSYLMVPVGQKTLRPTVVAMYNYLQPVCAAVFAMISGTESLTFTKIVSILLIFTGVTLVSKSRAA